MDVSALHYAELSSLRVIAQAGLFTHHRTQPADGRCALMRRICVLTGFADLVSSFNSSPEDYYADRGFHHLRFGWSLFGPSTRMARSARSCWTSVNTLDRP